MTLRIRFKGEPFLLIGDSLEDGGAIATEEQYTNSLPSTAHLMEGGRVMQWGAQIGTRADVEVIGPWKNTMSEADTAEAIFKLITDPPWTKPQ